MIGHECEYRYSAIRMQNIWTDRHNLPNSIDAYHRKMRPFQAGLLVLSVRLMTENSSEIRRIRVGEDWRFGHDVSKKGRDGFREKVRSLFRRYPSGSPTINR
jgi:hypothetical protein